MTDGVFGNKRLRRSHLVDDGNVLNSHSRKKDTLPVREDCRARFYEDYRKVADEYDKEFFKKYDEDLDTTLIFVSPARQSVGRVLIRPLGWFILCRNFRLHRRCQL